MIGPIIENEWEEIAFLWTTDSIWNMSEELPHMMSANCKKAMPPGHSQTEVTRSRQCFCTCLEPVCKIQKVVQQFTWKSSQQGSKSLFVSLVHHKAGILLRVSVCIKFIGCPRRMKPIYEVFKALSLSYFPVDKVCLIATIELAPPLFLGFAHTFL